MHDLPHHLAELADVAAKALAGTAACVPPKPGEEDEWIDNFLKWKEDKRKFEAAFNPRTAGALVRVAQCAQRMMALEAELFRVAKIREMEYLEKELNLALEALAGLGEGRANV